MTTAKPKKYQVKKLSILVYVWLVPLKDLSSGRLLKLTSLTLLIWSENMLKTLALVR